jgi:predicted DNA-binding transcriptional regulator YafY
MAGSVPRGRNSQAVRVVRLLKRIEGRRYRPTTSDLAREFGVTRRTIIRDLQAIEEAHVAVPPMNPEDMNEGWFH